MFVYDQIDMNK